MERYSKYKYRNFLCIKDFNKCIIFKSKIILTSNFIRSTIGNYRKNARIRLIKKGTYWNYKEIF